LVFSVVRQKAPDLRTVTKRRFFDILDRKRFEARGAIRRDGGAGEQKARLRLFAFAKATADKEGYAEASGGQMLEARRGAVDILDRKRFEAFVVAVAEEGGESRRIPSTRPSALLRMLAIKGSHFWSSFAGSPDYDIRGAGKVRQCVGEEESFLIKTTQR